MADRSRWGGGVRAGPLHPPGFHKRNPRTAGTVTAKRAVLHTWFVLQYLLGYSEIRNYDGSWTEWGNLVRTPIEKP